jgi:signal transduction histidine kinase
MLVRLRDLTGATAVDLAVVLVLGVTAGIDAFVGSGWQGPRPVNAVVVALLAAALLWRRRLPLSVLTFVATATVVTSLAFGSSDSSTGFFFIVVAAYSAAAHATRPFVAAAVLAVAIGVHDLRDPKVTGFADALYAATVIALVFLFGLGMRARQARTAAVERERDQVGAAAVEEERRRIARELHDIISHSLGVLVLQAGAAEQVLDRDPERAREVLRSIRATGQQAIGEMGTMLALVRGEAESSRQPQPSLADLGRLVATTREAGLHVELAIEGEPCELPAALELSAFRIIQEGLTNALKHAGAAQVQVALRYGERNLEVAVTDDGTGSASGPGTRRGLAGIGERVAVFGGLFEAGPQPEGGWRVRAALPLTR